MSTTTERQAAYRDASFLRCPDTLTPKKAHVLSAEGTPLCGLQAVMGDFKDAVDIPESARCARPGCRSAWKEIDDE